MQAGDFIIDASLISLEDMYCLAIEYTHSSDIFRESTRVLKINGSNCLLDIKVEWLKFATVKLIVQHSETGNIHFVFAPNPESNPLVPSNIAFFEWRAEDVEGDISEAEEHGL